jgi:carboxyl-terminal processing protease
MSKTVKSLLLLFTFITLGFVVAGSVGVKAGSKDNDGAYRQLMVYSEVLSRIRTDYVDEPNIPNVTNGALHGLLEALDADSSYMDPAEYKQFKQHRDTRADIGAAVSKRFGYAAVVAVVPGGPAEKAGVENSDIIEAIEARSTRDMSLAEIHSALAGEPGSTVNISVVRPRKAQPQKIAIIRDVVKAPPITAKMLDNQIGYIRVDGFPKGRAQELATKIQELTRQNAQKLVLDLRGSGSGEQSEGVAAANLFLNHGEIGYVQGQKFPKQQFTADPAKAITALPLVLIVNRTTAGPSELLAGAILENARGDVLGDKTFGQGSIQKLMEMQDGSALILSIAKYYTPAGKAIQDTSITPNIMVADAADDFISPDDSVDSATPEDQQPQKKDKPDEQLRRAIEVLKNKAPRTAEMNAPEPALAGAGSR